MEQNLGNQNRNWSNRIEIKAIERNLEQNRNWSERKLEQQNKNVKIDNFGSSD